MKKSHLIILTAVVLAMTYYFFHDFKNSKNSSDVVEEVADEVTDLQNQNRQQDQQNNNLETKLESPAATSQTTTNQTAVNSELQEALINRFSIHLQSLDKCLRLGAATASPGAMGPASITYESVLNHIQTSLGQPIVQLEDWTQFDVIDKTGVKKRVRVDYDYPDGATPNRRLSMYTLNRYGAYEVDNLTNDQSDNPNQGYIDSLKEGNTLQGEEQAARVYFAQGEELVYTSKSGVLDTITFSKGENSFICQNLGDINSNCNCSQ